MRIASSAQPSKGVHSLAGYQRLCLGPVTLENRRN